MFKQKFSFAVILFSIFFPGLLIAQQEMKDQLYLVHEEIAKVDMWDQYEKTSRQWVEYMNEAGLDLAYVRASQRDDGHYYYLIPISNYADIDKFPDIFKSAIDKIGKDKWDSFMKENNSSMESTKDFVAKWSAEYSYVPKQPRIKPEEAGFIHWIFFNYKLEKRKEVLDVLAEWKSLYEKNNVPDGWSIWLIDLGLDNIMIALSEYAKDGASFYTNMKENSDKLKSEEDKLWAKLSANVLNIEQKYGKPRPDLSYIKK
jgi:hypothetical protein